MMAKLNATPNHANKAAPATPLTRNSGRSYASVLAASSPHPSPNPIQPMLQSPLPSASPSPRIRRANDADSDVTMHTPSMKKQRTSLTTAADTSPRSGQLQQQQPSTQPLLTSSMPLLPSNGSAVGARTLTRWEEDFAQLESLAKGLGSVGRSNASASANNGNGLSHASSVSSISYEPSPRPPCPVPPKSSATNTTAGLGHRRNHTRRQSTLSSAASSPATTSSHTSSTSNLRMLQARAKLLNSGNASSSASTPRLVAPAHLPTLNKRPAIPRPQAPPRHSRAGSIPHLPTPTAAPLSSLPPSLLNRPITAPSSPSTKQHKSHRLLGPLHASNGVNGVVGTGSGRSLIPHLSPMHKKALSAVQFGSNAHGSGIGRPMSAHSPLPRRGH